MIGIEIDVAGFPAWLMTARQRQIDQLRAVIRRADKQALSAWVLRGRPGLQDRFDASRAQRLQLTERSPTTIKRKLKRWGSAHPYRSIRRRGAPHLRDLLRQPAGHRVSSRNKTTDVSTRLRLPGARVLNRPGNGRAGPIYRREFVGITRAGAHADRDWITRERSGLIAAWITAQIARTSRQRRARWARPRGGGARYVG